MTARKWFYTGLSGAILFFVFDRIAKWLVINYVWQIMPCGRFMYLDCVLNRGISHGLLYFHDTIAYAILGVIIAALLVGVIVWTYRVYRQGGNIVGHMLVISGGLSNVIDRVLYGGVVDYIGLTVCGWHFPIFNIADAAVVLGVGILIMQGLRSEN